MDVENDLNDETPASDELCRLCANTDKQLIPIFQGEGIEHNIEEQIKKYLPIITVTKLDKLPLQICYQCTSTLIAWHNFFEQCRVADNRLREIINADDKVKQNDDESCHDSTDDFHNDFEDQATTSDDIQVEAILTESTVSDPQPMEISDNIHSEVSKNESQSAVENIDDSRCLRMTNEFIDQEDICANMPGTICSGPRLSRHLKYAVQQHHVEDAIMPADSETVEKCSFGICPCVWNNNDECSRCTSFNKFACDYCSLVFMEARTRNRHLRKLHRHHLFDYCFNWLYENSVKMRSDEVPLEESREMSVEVLKMSTFQCHECGITLSDKNILITHLRSHSTKKQIGQSLNVFFCDHCSVVSGTKAALIAHLQSAHPDIFSNAAEHQVKPAANRNSDYYTCDICGHIFLRFHSFIRHLRRHTSGRYACSDCKRSFSSERALNSHNADHHKELPKNMFVLNGRKYLKCEQCPFTCRNECNKLEEHMRVHTGEKPFTCETCGKQFRTRSLLGVHRRFVHDGVKQFPCDICGRCFSNRRYTEEHRRIHTGEKPLICDLCGKSFRQSSSLMKHLDYHMGIRRHPCHLCNKRFSNGHHLKVHIKRHMGVASHVCAQCGKAFVDQYQLKNHYVVHSEARPYVCKQCGASFKLRKHLKQHGRTHKFVS